MAPHMPSNSWRGIMHLFGIRVFEQQDDTTRQVRGKSGRQLRVLAAAMLTLAAGVPSGFAQQAAPPPTDALQTAPPPTDKEASALPPAPAPILTQPLFLRPFDRDFSKPAGRLLGNPINMYRPTTIAKADFNNSVRLTDLVKDGKIYLSLSDAIALALENNYDIAIGRYYLDIADLDLLRAKAGSGLRGVGATVVNNTLGGTSTTLSSSGAPGGASGATTGSSGVTLTTDGAGPAPENLDPVLGGTVQLERARSEERRVGKECRS